MQKIFRVISWLTWGLLSFIITAAVLLALPVWQQVQRQSNYASRDPRSISEIGGLTRKQYQQLARINFVSGHSAVYQVNGGKSTLNPKAWRHDQVVYQQLDSLGRTSSSTVAMLNWHNHANTALRIQQRTDPSGWHDNRNQKMIYNRGHLIAYSLTGGIDPQTGRYNGRQARGDQDNPRNLFTETDFTNQALQTIYETRVRHAIEDHHQVIYQATPIFRGSEQMARGINLQALSTDGSLNFNVYLLNVEPGTAFNYQDGTSWPDDHMQVAVPLASDNQDVQGQGQSDAIKVTGTYRWPMASQPRTYYRTSNPTQLGK